MPKKKPEAEQPDPKALDTLNKDLMQNWVLPEAQRRGFDYVWLRTPDTNTQNYSLRYRTREDIPEEPTLLVTLKTPEPNWEQQPDIGRDVFVSEIDWDAFKKDYPNHLLLDAVEVRLGIADTPPIFFNQEADQDVLRWGERLDAYQSYMAEAHPEGGAFGDKAYTLKADGTKVPLSPLPKEAQELWTAAEAARVAARRPYAVIVWDLARERLYTQASPAALEAAARGEELTPEMMQASQAALPAISQPEPKEKARRPKDALAIRQITGPIRWPTDTHLTSLALEVALSEPKPEVWPYKPELYGYAYQSEHGMAVIENVNEEAMQRIVTLFGPQGLQVTFGVLQHIEEAVMRKHGTLVPWEELAPGYRIVCTDVLRSLNVPAEGNGYRMDKQAGVRHILKAVAAVQFMDIQPTSSKRKKYTVGPLLNVLHSELETSLPFDEDEVPPKHELLSVLVQPGKAAWELRRKGIPWCHHSLLTYNAKRQGPEIVLTAYAGQLAVNSRNSEQHDGFRRLDTLLKHSGIKDSKKPSRAADRLERALESMAARGAIPAEQDARTGNYRPIYIQPAADMTDADPTAARLACSVKLFDFSKAYGNGYEPLPGTSKTPLPA